MAYSWQRTVSTDEIPKSVTGALRPRQGRSPRTGPLQKVPRGLARLPGGMDEGAEEFSREWSEESDLILSQTEQRMEDAERIMGDGHGEGLSWSRGMARLAPLRSAVGGLVERNRDYAIKARQDVTWPLKVARASQYQLQPPPGEQWLRSREPGPGDEAAEREARHTPGRNMNMEDLEYKIEQGRALGQSRNMNMEDLEYKIEQGRALGQSGLTTFMLGPHEATSAVGALGRTIHDADSGYASLARFGEHYEDRMRELPGGEGALAMRGESDRRLEKAGVGMAAELGVDMAIPWTPPLRVGGLGRRARMPGKLSEADRALEAERARYRADEQTRLEFEELDPEHDFSVTTRPDQRLERRPAQPLYDEPEIQAPGQLEWDNNWSRIENAIEQGDGDEAFELMVQTDEINHGENVVFEMLDRGWAARQSGDQDAMDLVNEAVERYRARLPENIRHLFDDDAYQRHMRDNNPRTGGLTPANRHPDTQSWLDERGGAAARALTHNSFDPADIPAEEIERLHNMDASDLEDFADEVDAHNSDYSDWIRENFLGEELEGGTIGWTEEMRDREMTMISYWNSGENGQELAREMAARHGEGPRATGRDGPAAFSGRLVPRAPPVPRVESRHRRGPVRRPLRRLRSRRDPHADRRPPGTRGLRRGLRSGASVRLPGRRQRPGTHRQAGPARIVSASTGPIRRDGANDHRWPRNVAA